MEVARMFGGWPHDLDNLPTHVYRDYENHWLAVKEAEMKAANGENLVEEHDA